MYDEIIVMSHTLFLVVLLWGIDRKNERTDDDVNRQEEASFAEKSPYFNAHNEFAFWLIMGKSCAT